MMSGSRAVLDSQYAPFWGPNKFIFAKEHAYIGGDGMGRFRLPSVGLLREESAETGTAPATDGTPTC
jgi:hypothetical protein